jgi:V/A-type H+-transporting ATPase subunit F
MLEIAVIGGSEFILGFQLAGIRKTIDADDNPEKKVRDMMQDPNVGVLVIDDKTVGRIPERLREDLERSVKPVTVILSLEAVAQDNLRKMIKRSIGIDLWQE